MKRIFILSLVFILLLCSCEKDVTTATTTETTLETEIHSAVQVTTTAAETLPPEPAFEVPAVVSAVKYEKPIIDIFGSGEGAWNYPHSVEYPQINSDKPGAIALNEKIAKKYEKIITELKNGNEENRIYNFSYTASECEGAIFICVDERVGWQYSEGMTTNSIFYYDSANDKELTAKEYAARFGIDIEKATEKVLYTHELACAYYESTGVMISSEDENAIHEPAQGILFPAKQTELDFDFCGIEVSSDTVKLYFGGQMYVYSIYEFSFDRETLEPKNPYYRGYLLPNDASGDIFINLENGTVASYALPKESDVYEIAISSKCVTVFSRSHFDLNISINGGEPFFAGGQTYHDENQYQYDFYINEYIPIENLKTIKFVK